MDFPDEKEIDLGSFSEKGIDLYLVILESAHIRPENWKKENHKYFKKIFIWDESWVDNKKYFLLKATNKIPDILY